MTTTYATFPDLVYDGGRYAQTVWPGASVADAVAATLRLTPDAVVMLAKSQTERVAGFGPAGLGAL